MKKASKKMIFNFNLDDEMRFIIDYLRKDLDLNVSAMIRRFLKQYYEDHKINKV